MLTSHTILKFLRKVHLYIGIFIAPALLFFAFTGALQTFSLHETTQGSNYKPPAWLVKLGQLHKKQTTIVPVRKLKPPLPDKPTTDSSKPDNPAAPLAAGRNREAKAADAPQPSTKSNLPMKIFFLVVAIGLFVSTLTGIYMAYKYTRRTFVVTGLLLAGIIVPLLFLFV